MDFQLLGYVTHRHQRPLRRTIHVRGSIAKPRIIDIGDRPCSRGTIGLYPALPEGRRIRWTYHVTMRLQQRNLTSELLFDAVDTLEIVEAYPRDKYLPSFLLRGEQNGVLFNAQIATDTSGDNIRVVTMYVPDAQEWEDDGRLRRRAQ
jgi:hypothetical protein